MINAISFIIISVFGTQYSHADVFDELRECSYTCSEYCLILSRNLINSAENTITTCGNANSDVINACVNRFGNGTSGATCSQTARSSNVVNACVDRFGNGTSGSQCARFARSADIVNTCVDRFGNGSAGLQCIGVQE